MERQIKGIWIPIEIWENKELTWNEKILFLDIDSFTSKNMDCFISNEYISKLLGVNETSANRILSSLIKKGYIIKTKFDGRKRYVKSALQYSINQTYDLAQPCIANCDNIPNIFNNKDNIKEDTIVSKKENIPDNNDLNDNVEELYKLYPTKCPTRGVSLSKSFKDKVKIKKLLKKYGYDMLKFTIKKEIEEKYGKHYMSNFSTFLNNLPDYGYDNEKENNEIIDDSKVVYGGIEYK